MKGTNPGFYTRRSFLKTAALGAGASVLLGSMAACAEQKTSQEAMPSTGDSSAAAISGQEPSIEVIDTDVLVVGGSLNGLYAANQILDEGGHVTVVDKGVWRHTGVAGVREDLFNANCPFMSNMTEENLANMELTGKAVEMFGQNDETYWTYMVNRGEVISTRFEDGSPEPFMGQDYISQGYFFHKQMDRFVGNDNVNVYDRTMITELLISDGVCRGAIGLHLPTGNLRVFRANAVVGCAGGCYWIFGWDTMRTHTEGYNENTADLDMAAWHAGCGLADNEFGQYDICGIYPSGLSYATDSNICAEPMDADILCDKDGNHIFDNLNAEDAVAVRDNFNQMVAKAIYEDGRGSENNGLFFNMGELKTRLERMRNKRNIPLLEKFGVDTDNFMMECKPTMYDKGGAPIVDSSSMTEIPGLFYGRGAGCGGSSGGMFVNLVTLFGRYAGHCALEYARNVDPATDIDLSKAVSEYDRLQGIRTFTCSDPVSPYEVRVAIQNAGEIGLGIYRTADMMNDALDQLAHVRSDLLPRMQVRDTSCVYNIDWKQAIEAYNMLDCCEMSIRASLMREETRGNYFRGDFPETDNESWQCRIVCRDVNGEMQFETAPIA